MIDFTYILWSCLDETLNILYSKFTKENPFDRYIDKGMASEITYRTHEWAC